jgi:hypothetical protein
MKSGTTIHSRHCWVSRPCKDRRKDQSKGRRNPALFYLRENPRFAQTRTAPRSTAQSAPLRLRWLGCGTTASPLRSAWAPRGCARGGSTSHSRSISSNINTNFYYHTNCHCHINVLRPHPLRATPLRNGNQSGSPPPAMYPSGRMVPITSLPVRPQGLPSKPPPAIA